MAVRRNVTRVCFVAPHAYPLLDPSASAPVGGIETRSVAFARSLARRPEFDVWFLVEDYRQPWKQVIEGITVVAYIDARERLRRETIWPLSCRIRASLMSRRHHGAGCSAPSRRHLLRDVSLLLFYRQFLQPFLRPSRWPKRPVYTPTPKAIYRDIRADVFVPFGVNWVSAETAASCRRYGGKCALFLASNMNLSEKYVRGSREVDWYGEYGNACRYAIDETDQILAQTVYQQELLKSRFGRDSTLIRNPIELASGDDLPTMDRGRQHVLWVGRSDADVKRPRLCLDLAQRCPEIPFLMIMNKDNAGIFDAIMQQHPGNVRLVERVSSNEMASHFRQAVAFVNTSSQCEGFPNVFLQAGKFGTPILSLEVDPDGVLRKNGCGLVADGDVGKLAEDVRMIWADRTRASDLARRMREYVATYHALEGRTEELAQALTVLGQQDSRRTNP